METSRVGHLLAKESVREGMALASGDGSKIDLVNHVTERINVWNARLHLLLYHLNYIK